MILTYVILLAILAVTFLLSNFFRLNNLYAGSDCYFQYAAAEHIKNNHYRAYDSISYYTLPTPPDYPPLIHYLLALLPSNKLIPYGRFSGSFFDLLHKIFVFIVALSVTNDSTVALLSVVAFSLIHSVSLDQLEASARPIGSFFFSILLFALYQYQTTPTSLHIIVAVAALALGFLSLKFFTQTTVLAFVFFTIYYTSFVYLVLLAIASFVLIVFFRKRFFVIVETIWSTIFIWFSMRHAPHPGKKGYSKIFVDIYYLFLVNIVDLLLIFFVFAVGLTLPSSLMFFFTVALFFRAVAFLVYYISWFKCLGEAYRYFSYSALPSAVCLAYLVVMNAGNLFVVSLSIIVMFVSLVSLLLWQREYKRNHFYFSTPEMIASLRRLERYTIKNLLVIPFQYSRNVAYLTKKNTFIAISQRYFSLIREITWGTADINDIICKNRISHVLVYKTFIPKYNIKNAKTLFSNEFTLYKILDHSHAIS